MAKAMINTAMHTFSPNLFIIGAPKAGTTTLASWLSSHAEIFWSIPKEPYHFAADFPGQRDHYGFSSREDYLFLYDQAAARHARYRGDGSTTYLYSDRAVPAILDMDPSARFIVSVRNPVDLLPSYHRTQVVVLNEDRVDFAEAWHGSLEGRPPGVQPLDRVLVDYSRIGKQGAAIQQLLTRVSRNQVHFIVFDDIVSAPREVWLRLCADLDLDGDSVAQFSATNASNKRPRYPLIRRLTHRPPRFAARPLAHVRQWSRTTSIPGVRRLKGSLWAAAPAPAISDQLSRELAEYFSADVSLLSNLLGRDLSRWSRPRIKD
ncbi:MAG: sulfotransferase [Ornithinimicrobium sp.]